MNTVLGANWRTTLTGWITVLASAIAVNPSLISFLPESARSTITGVAGLIAVLSGGTFAYAAKDRQVTGGSVTNDAGKEPPISRITPLLLMLMIPIFALSGCAWITTHQPQIKGTLAVVGQRALTVAENVLIAAAVDEADKNFKANFLDSVATGLRANETNIVTSGDVEKIVKIWSPNDGAQWQALAGQLGSIAGSALQAAGQEHSAVVVEQIATGLNNAAASARATP